MDSLSLVTSRYDEHVPLQQQCAVDSHLLERMVHAFLSCANTGNVKVSSFLGAHTLHSYIQLIIWGL